MKSFLEVLSMISFGIIGLGMAFSPASFSVRVRELKEGGHWFFLNYILFEIVFGSYLYFLTFEHSSLFPLLDKSRFTFTMQLPFVFQFLICLLMMDLGQYVIHRAMHRVPFLWEFHKIHHSAEDLSSLVNVRYTWLDFYLNMNVIFIFSLIFKVHPQAYFLANLFFGIYGYYNHSNIRYEKSWLRVFFVTPMVHRIHHVSTKDRTKWGVNFAGLFFVLDHLFGTAAYDEELLTRKVGLNGNDELPQGVLRRFFYPFSKQSYFIKMKGMAKSLFL